MTTLLDANVLIALTVVDHVHHEIAEDWFVGTDEAFATCPVTQGALIRFLLRSGATAAVALDVLHALAAHDAHVFWPDSVSYADLELRGVVGHRQLTDAYLAGLARARSRRLATLDRALATLHADVVLLLDAPAA